MSYVIRDNCMNCQRCAAQCPVQAIYFDGVHPQIDPGKCISCGACAEICRIDAPWDPAYPPAPPEPHDLIELECGLVVIGGGGSGLVCAAKASELTDEKVIVLEKNTRPGGGAWYAGAVKTYGSRWQKEHDCGDYLEAHFHKYMDYTRGRLDPHLVYNCFKYTGEFFDWYYDGLPDELKSRYHVGYYHVDGKDAHPTPMYASPVHDGSDSHGRRVMERCLEILESRGGEVLTSTRAVDLETKDGKITAVMAEDGGGKLRIRCKAVYMAPGSWIHNREILEKYCPRFAYSTPTRSAHLNPNYTGDGIPLAEKAGAFIDYDSFVMRNMGPFYYDWMQCMEKRNISAISFDPRVIWVNKLGKRWTDECILERVDPFETGTALEYQPGAVSFNIFSQNILEASAKQNLADERTAECITGPCVFSDCWREDIDKAASEGTHLRRADTLRELAEICGIDPDGLEETVKAYNRMCLNGSDDDFHKAPSELMPLEQGPFYGVVCYLQTDGAFGGILVNEHSQAYAADGKNLMPNLWAGGDFSSGRFINEGGVKRQITDDLAWAFSGGYNAGIHIAEYLNG